jgi:hypothetical protein
VAGKKVFVLEYLQARAPERVAVPFFAEFDEDATWFDQLRPIREADQWLFEDAVTRHHERDEVPTPIQITRRPGPVDSRPDRAKRSPSPMRTEK